MSPHRFVVFALAPLFALLCAAPLTAQQKELTFEDVRRARFVQALPSAAWSEDGALVRIGRGDEERWYDPVKRADVEAPSAARGADSLGARVRIEDGTRLQFTDESGTQRTLVDDSRPKRLAALAPGGAHASFVSGSDLVVVPTGEGEPWTIGNGDPDLLHGVLDWVHQEEIYGRGNFNAHWWSGTGAHVAFLVIDQSSVPNFTVVDHVPDEPRSVNRGVVAETTRYPKAGDPNPVTKLCVAHPADRSITTIDLSSQPDGFLVVRVGWTPSGERLVVTVQDRIQQRAELLLADPVTGKVQSLVTETSTTWVERPEAPRWLADGSFLWQSERTGYTHIYRYDTSGTLLETVTAGPWRVVRIVRVDETAGRVWFMGTKDGALGHNLYSTDLGPSDEVKRWTRGDGSHRVEFDAAGTYFLDRWSTIEAPAMQRLVCATTGDVLFELAAEQLDPQFLFLPPERLSIAARDGYALDALVIRPREGEHDGPRPVFVDTYSGPDAPTVSDSFRPSAWLQFLAQRGAIVLQVNVRSASGRGHAHTATCYGKLGLVELADLEDAVDHVVAHFNGDRDRVAISGWSYGGFMAALALTHSDRFSLGLAGAGVYDWRLYDTIYTERFMSTPQLNPEGYAATSVIEHAAKLRGHLVIMHGTMDDNVHLQNAIQLVDALQQAGKLNFDLMLYANARHGVGSPHLAAYRWSKVKQHLGLSD